ncbi:MAG: hypothetical protein PHW63_02120 [Alphaproteobacteria bacterium]|nr:hypothetical protein [Alphaproteobacteria bacterium]
MIDGIKQEEQTAAMPSCGSGGSREHEGGAAEVGATPFNKAPSVPIIRVLRYGIDSLFLSFQGRIFKEREAQLADLKKFAQSDDPSQRADAQLEIGDHLFEVKDKGSRAFSYCLADKGFFIKLNKSRQIRRKEAEELLERGYVPSSQKTLPFASVQISSEYLTAVGSLAAMEELRGILSELGLVDSEKVSRADLFVDFTTDFDFSYLQSNDFITNCKSFHRFEEKPNFSGVSMGMGGLIGFRLYNKTLEMKLRPRDYLFAIWEAAGRIEDQDVWRAEFEIKRDALKHMHLGERIEGTKPSGINTVAQLVQSQSGLWEYLTQEWLRMVVPNPNDAHRERWETHPLWQDIQSAFAELPHFPIERQSFDFSRPASDDWIFRNGFAGLTSFMAREGIDDIETAFEEMTEQADLYLSKGAPPKNKGALTDLRNRVSEKVLEKRMKFNKFVAGKLPRIYDREDFEGEIVND